jgi:hypothetical protein
MMRFASVTREAAKMQDRIRATPLYKPHPGSTGQSLSNLRHFGPKSSSVRQCMGTMVRHNPLFGLACVEAR